MRIYALPLYLALVSIANWADDGDSDGRRTGGGGSVFAEGANVTVVRRRDLNHLKLKSNDAILRQRRAGGSGVFSIGHQFAGKRGDISSESVCQRRGNVLLVHEFSYSSSHLKASGLSGGCVVVLNGDSEKPDAEQKGFAVGKKLGSGNSLYDRQLGIDAVLVSGTKVSHDMRVRLGGGEVDVVLSAMFSCDDPSAFRCQHSQCISQSAMCDDVNNCDDGTDETGWRCGPLGDAKILTFFAFAILALVFFLPFCLVRRWKRKKKPKTSHHGISSASSASSR